VARREDLFGRWVHAHEEDAEGETVYRADTVRLPPSRGREVLELRADGSCLTRRPGPADVPVEHEGRWGLDGEDALWVEEGDKRRRLDIVALAPDRLVVRR
jgi:hypothetical protein